MKYDFTIHSMQPSIHLLFGLNNLKIRNINVEVVNDLVVLTLDGSTSISHHSLSFVSSNTLKCNILKSTSNKYLSLQPLNTVCGKAGQSTTLPSEFEGFSNREMNTINNWLYNILIIEKNDSITA